MAYIYPSLKPRTTALPITKQTFAGGYQNAVLAMQNQQMPVGMDARRWREQQRANARRLGRVFSGGGGRPQTGAGPVNRGAPPPQPWQGGNVPYGGNMPQPAGSSFTPGIDPSYESYMQMQMNAQQPIMLQAGQPRPGMGMGAGMMPPSGIAPTAPTGGLRQRGAVRPRPLRSTLPRPKYTTNV